MDERNELLRIVVGDSHKRDLSDVLHGDVFHTEAESEEFSKCRHFVLWWHEFLNLWHSVCCTEASSQIQDQLDFDLHSPEKRQKNCKKIIC